MKTSQRKSGERKRKRRRSTPLRIGRARPEWTFHILASAPPGIGQQLRRTIASAAGYGGLSAALISSRLSGLECAPDQIVAFVETLHDRAGLTCDVDAPRIVAIHRFLKSLIASASASKPLSFIDATASGAEVEAFWPDGLAIAKIRALRPLPTGIVNLVGALSARRWYAASEIFGALDLWRFGVTLGTLRTWRRRCAERRSKDVRTADELGSAAGCWLRDEGGDELAEKVVGLLTASLDRGEGRA